MFFFDFLRCSFILFCIHVKPMVLFLKLQGLVIVVSEAGLFCTSTMKR
ncbi:hypothetical protein CLOSTASPAR_05341 [[Clostridium] asparagiforme DSM 15981]|uniref:Uncharacterized protein n=1 Tax=[Clostridium] asparagiforme DSM 15981 TaxID=518636 RepID=C0D7U4_9FIRM|nr:hypothetical protein CLOSTASPAR_05341 [[Clostridium] asparagiforme DSM 15981]